ncbi:MAG: type III-B CRISPR module RAMP protein Cmr4 [Desulfobulbaceae bacterium DB1]|nr:MAG: type III-B CRISPR module RAMP protein Cmr4 [Desulfobulbaceae bacterium DB1]
MSDPLNVTYGNQIILMTIDPVHVGTGGMRLGRVDNTIVREPGTRLPKIPGTSLSGAIRQYAARRFNKMKCAGQTGHCGQPTCPICYTFGFVNSPNTGKSSAGVVSLSDARILLFPVYSMTGPVWVTCPSALRDMGITGIPSLSDKSKAIWKSEVTQKNCINLGWLMLEKEGGNKTLPPVNGNIPTDIQNRMVIVSDGVFPQIVNSNLEVRTSVSIDPETGAASDGALFTYEAIPRATILWMDVVQDDFRKEFPSMTKLSGWQALLNKSDEEGKKEQIPLLINWNLLKKNEQNDEKVFGKAMEESRKWFDDDCLRYYDMKAATDGRWGNGSESDDTAMDVVFAGLDLAEYFGIGGMGTRGFGRIRRLPAPPQPAAGKEVANG